MKHIGLQVSALAVFALAAFAPSAPAYAQGKLANTFCFGETLEECHSRFGDGYPVLGCSRNASERTAQVEAYAQEICTLRGSGTPVDFTLSTRQTESGNSCGYTLIDVICFWERPLEKKN